jgi:mannose-1-phosphate guanylyltransferase/mannose-6-phosphate isomerase
MENIVNDNNKCCSAITITYNSYWNDIGSYAALYNEVAKNDDNNFIKGHVLTLNTKNSYIETDSKFTSVIGVDNLIIINSDDSLLICNKDDSQNVKKVVDYLKKNNYEEAYVHKKVFRPWGFYVNIEGSDYNGFRVKKIAVYQGKRLSLQSHEKRSEHWVIVKGNAKVQIGTLFIILKKDDHVYIPIKTLHRIENIGDELLEFTETQIGDYLGEDDIIRYEDDFGRV